MKEKELREHTTCSNCRKPIGHTGLPLFWKLTVERHGVDMGAVRRQDGLAAVLGGSVELAQAMGTDPEMTVLLETVEITLCEACAMSNISIAVLALGG